MWMRNQLLDYGLSYSKIPIYYDNQSAIAMTGNPVQHSLTKLISIRYHFIREQVLEGTIELHFVPTDQQLADIFTKPLPEATFNKLDFLASSPLKYALTEPASVSFKSVLQVWNTSVFGKGPSGTILMNFEFNGVTYHVTPAVVEEALHLPILGNNVPDTVTDSTLFDFVTKMGYNGEVKRYDSLFRTKLKREWNFYFDTC
ncbi:hypothetical protein POM88_029414 [Heracleum sosnowskyi]|uniref:Uncharacterized protein n=1 Tax=Heracleum sosnowskyi TaxID=360622 RepID=A0AAD8HU01_9APIA|nr:hypothetical protein POM88_029414 [Heracleum sosnowskyi]